MERIKIGLLFTIAIIFFMGLSAVPVACNYYFSGGKSSEQKCKEECASQYEDSLKAIGCYRKCVDD